MRMRPITRGLLPLLAAFALIIAAVPAWAQGAHIRGEITAMTDSELSLKTKSGRAVTVPVDGKTGYFLVSKGSLQDIGPGKFVGITSVDKDGKLVAEEVHVFAEQLRGLGEGHYPWDRDETTNMMTNANIAKVEPGSSGDVLKLNYQGGEQTITVPPGTPVVTFDKADKSALAVGRHVFVIMPKDPANKAAAFVVVGAEGVTPPM